MSATKSPFTKHEELRMFALKMAIDSKPIHFAEKDQELSELVLHDARKYFAFLTEGVEPPRSPVVVA